MKNSKNKENRTKNDFFFSKHQDLQRTKPDPCSKISVIEDDIINFQSESILQ